MRDSDDAQAPAGANNAILKSSVEKDSEHPSQVPCQPSKDTMFHYTYLLSLGPYSFSQHPTEELDSQGLLDFAKRLEESSDHRGILEVHL